MFHRSDETNSLWLSEQPVNHTVHNLLLQSDPAVPRFVLLLDCSDSLTEQPVGSRQDVGLVDDGNFGRSLQGVSNKLSDCRRRNMSVQI
jgi:hypothetical protein